MKEVFQKLLEAAPGNAAQHGVNFALGPVHLDPGHRILVLLDAPTQDAVLDALQANRMGQIQDVEVYRATPLPELFARNAGQEALW